MPVIAQLSDTHIDDAPASAAKTARVFDYLHGFPHPVDAILVTGDIADNGREEEYRVAAKLFASPLPVLVCPGNHDVRDAYRKGLLGIAEGGGEPINARHDVAGAVFLVADSSIPGKNEGRIDETTLGWLAAELAGIASTTPTFIAFHHPPVVLHHEFIDSIRLLDPEPLADLIAAHPQVAGVLTGHAHTAAAGTFAGRPLLVAPGVISTLRLPWEGAGPFADRTQPPGVAFHVWDDTGRLVTHYRTVV